MIDILATAASLVHGPETYSQLAHRAVIPLDCAAYFLRAQKHYWAIYFLPSYLPLVGYRVCLIHSRRSHLEDFSHRSYGKRALWPEGRGEEELRRCAAADVVVK